MKFLCFVFEPEVTAVVISFAVLSIMVDVPESLIEAPRMTLLIAAEAVIEFDIEKEFPEIKENEGYVQTKFLIEKLNEIGYGEYVEYSTELIRGFDYYVAGYDRSRKLYRAGSHDSK